jgi:hypothetical protein
MRGAGTWSLYSEPAEGFMGSWCLLGLFEVGEDGKHPSVIVRAGWDAQFGKDVRDVFS